VFYFSTESLLSVYSGSKTVM